MAGTLDGRRVAILAADGVERVELEQPRRALEDAGARTDVVSLTNGEIQARDHDLDDAGTFPVDRVVQQVSPDDYDTVRTDLRNAGAEVVDEQVVTDGNITTSRSPDDLPAFCERILREFAKTPEPAGGGGGA
ncbi:DJ-1/PfpI family protein [Amycolatopsis sp. 3B14]|uniref:DJ-1/PfpI family protein n=1 Tax=Amycolatopsis sp. 3B14 TaxID=3243600 RepID=UPI003D990620